MEKIFVSVGTHPQQFDRLIKKMDEIAVQKKGKFTVFGQIGHSKYTPKNFQFKRFLSGKEFEEKIEKCSLVIGHAGAGIIISALSHNKKAIIMPRLEEFKEHTNSHQKDIAKSLAGDKKVLAVYSEESILGAIEKSREFVPETKNHTKEIVAEIERFVKRALQDS